MFTIVSLPPPSSIVCKLDHRLHSNIIFSFHRLALGQMTLVKHILVHIGRQDIWILAASNVGLTKSDHWNRSQWLLALADTPTSNQIKKIKKKLYRLCYNFLSFIFINSKLSNCVQLIQQGKLLKKLIKE